MGESLRALIIEDFEDDALLTARALKNGGFELVYECIDTAEALRAALERTTWDVIIADYSMPHFNGLDALRIVQERGLDLPFILVSGTIGEEIAVNAMRLGAHDYLMKNNLARLVPAVQRELQEARIRRERRMALDALRASEERYRNLFEMSPEAVILLALDGTIIDCNPAACQLGGIPIQNLIGKSFFSLGFVREQDTSFVKNLMAHLSTGQSIHQPEELMIVREDGETRWIEAFAVTIPEQDDVAAFQVICRDITERQKAEETLRRYAERLEILRQIDRSIAQARSPQEIAEVAVRHIQDLVACRTAAVLMFDFETHEAVLFATDFRLGLGIERGTRFSLETLKPHLETLRHGKIDIIEDTRLLARLDPRWLNWAGHNQATLINLPLIFQDELLGSLSLIVSVGDRFGEEESKVLCQLTDQLAIAIHQARLFEIERQQRARAEALREMAATLSSTLDLDEVLNLILQQLRDVIPYDTATIQQLEGSYLKISAVQGDSKLVGFKSAIRHDTPHSKICNEQKPLSIEDIATTYPHLEHSEVVSGDTRVRSWLGIPLINKDRVIGIITLGRTKIQAYTRDEIELAEAFANQAGIAIENAKWHQATQLRATQLELVGQVSRRAAAILDADEQLHQTVELIGSTFGYTHTDIWLIEPGKLVLRAGSGPAMDSFAEGIALATGTQGIVGWVADHGQPLLVSDVQQDSRGIALDQIKRAARSELAVPMKLREGVIGVVHVESDMPDAFSEIDLVTLQAIADQLTVSLHNAQLYEQIQRYADELEQRVQERTVELLHTTERVEAILSNSPDAILLLQPSGTISQINQAAIDLFGYQPDEMLSQSSLNLVQPESATRLQQALSAACELGHPSRVEMVARSKHNGLFDVDAAVAPIHENGQVVSLVCSIRDISALKEVERMKDAFVSNVSHELRTPITNIKLRQHLMKKSPERFHDHMAAMERETNRLANIIESLLYLSRMDQERVAWKPAAIDINNLASQYVEDQAALAESRQLTLQFSGDRRIKKIWADENLIGQALSALLINAFNYTPPGGQVQVSTRLETREQQEWVTLNVQDNGSGIAIEEQAHLFERFFRGSVGLRSGVPGTGLGLSIVQEIAKKHRGWVEVISDGVPGHGTTFKLWLPAISVG